MRVRVWPEAPTAVQPVGHQRLLDGRVGVLCGPGGQQRVDPERGLQARQGAVR